MSRRLRTGVLALTSLGSVVVGSVAAVADPYLVPKQDFDCLIHNIAAYLSASRDPVVIFFSVCPKVEPTAKDLQASTVDSLPQPGPSVAGAKNVITLTKAEISCIAAGKYTASLGQANTVTLDLKSCP